MEILNEITFYMVSLIYLTFTDFNPDAFAKVLMGWILITLVIANLIWPNGSTMVAGIWPDIRDNVMPECCRKKSNKRRHRVFRGSVRFLTLKREKFIRENNIQLKKEF